MTWDELIENVNKTSPVKIEKSKASPDHYGLSMVGSQLPISINQDEFNFIKNIVKRHNIKYAVEVATGMGIATLAIALGLKETGGKLISIDSYAEERQLEQLLHVHEGCVYTESKGYKLTDHMLSIYDCRDRVELKQGWSPNDIEKYYNEICGDNKIDFVMLDCPKCDQDVWVHTQWLKGRMANKFVVIIHDTHTFSHGVHNFIKDVFGKMYEHILCHNKWPLAIIENF